MTFPVLPANGPSGYNLTKSLRFRASASAYLNRTPGSTGNQQKFTWSGWVKLGALVDETFVSLGTTLGVNLRFTSFALQSNVLTVGSTTSTSVYRDPSAWYHIVLAVDTTQASNNNRLRLYVNGVEVTYSANATITQNANLGANTTTFHALGVEGRPGSPVAGTYFDGYMAEVNFIDGQALTPSSFGSTDSTTGVWQPARYTGTYGTNGFYLPFTNTTSTLLSNSSNISAPFGGVATNALVADGVFCTSNTSTGSSFSFLLNDFGVATPCTRYNIVSLSFTGGVSTFYIQGSSDNSSWSAPLASLSVTGTAQNFSGSLAGNYRYWRLAPVAFGTNGQAIVDQYVLFQEGIGNDFSGNGNNWTTNNISLTPGVTYDSMTDVPTLTSATAANYCVLNPLSTASVFSITNGNLTASSSTPTGTQPASFFLTSGKWYWESIGNAYAGAVCGLNGARFTGSISATGSNGIGYWEGGLVYWDGGNSGAGPASYTSSDVIGVALDMDAGTVAFYKNNSLQFTATFGSGTVPNLSSGCFPCYNQAQSGGTKTANFNFGQRPFAYTPPSGFVALNTFNLPSSTIPAGNKYMDILLYTGDGTNNRTITSSLGFTPGLAWGKSRSAALSHALIDSVRGNYQTISSNSTAAETAINSYNLSTANTLITWNSNETNQNGSTYVAWLWKANGAGVTNTAGSSTSAVSANTTSGFSVVTYTGTGANATVGHGLNVLPSMVIAKNRSGTSEWAVWHTSLGDNFVRLNATNPQLGSTPNGVFNVASFTSSVFAVGNGIVNVSASTYVAYCFAQIAGFSSFGSYTGNGSADGPFIYTGFRPRWIICKSTAEFGSWTIMDSARVGYNANNSTLYSDLTTVEQGYLPVDILSNGFKIRITSTGTSFNSSGEKYIYAAFAENPFKNALAR